MVYCKFNSVDKP
uniref:Uncharacterized protein n=1 Tax=Rhizophora mucronata TaxID=61149 RepID=A0A2P2P3K9_RHIMU